MRHRSAVGWMAVVLIGLGGCTYWPVEIRSGGYGASWNAKISADAAATQPSLVQAYVPPKIEFESDPRTHTDSLLIVELGEWSVPESVLQTARECGRTDDDEKRFVASLPSIGVEGRQWNTRALRSVLGILTFSPPASATGTQPTSFPTTLNGSITIQSEDVDLFLKEEDLLAQQESAETATRELPRLCEQARLLQADAILLMTEHQTVQQAQPTIFTCLDYLIVPIFCIPTETVRGVVAGRGWLIDAHTAKAFASVELGDTFFRLTTTWHATDTTSNLAETQRASIEQALVEQLLHNR